MSLHYLVKCQVSRHWWSVASPAWVHRPAARWTDTLNILMQKKTIKRLFLVVNFLNCVVTEVVLFSIVSFKTLDISRGSVATHLGVMVSLVIVLLQIFSWFRQWNNFENRLIFGKVMAYKNGASFLGHPVNAHINIIYCVSKKDTTQQPTIISTRIVLFQ